MIKLLIVVFLISVEVLSAQSQSIKIRFIGNASFQISDDSTTLLSDFPYRSGAYGYMKYDLEDVTPKGDVLCLVTHRHADHFDASLFKKTDWKLLAPEDIEVSVARDRRLAISKEVRFNGLRIYPIPTAHSNVDHYSYLVEWHGLRLFFTGDTESTEELMSVAGIDIIFITPWLLRDLKKRGQSLKAKRVVVYHHRKGENVEYPDCIVLRQGEEFEVDTK